MCAVALVPQLLCSSVAPFLCSCVGDDPTHDLERHSEPRTRSRSQSGGTELPTPCRDARITPHQGLKHHCPHPRRTTAPQQPDNAFLHTRQRPLHTTESPTHATPTRDVPRHPSNPTSLSSTHANTPHTISSRTPDPTPRRDHNQGQHKPPTPLPTHPTHDLERHSEPRTRSRSQSGGTELPTPCRDARITPHQGLKHHCPHPRRTTAPQQPDNAFLHTRQRPLHTTESPTHATPTRDVPRHPCNPTSLSSTHANTPHTTQTPGQANPPAPATTQDPTHQPCTAEGEHIAGHGPKAPHALSSTHASPRPEQKAPRRLSSARGRFSVEPPIGLEPMTCCLQDSCSTN